VADAPRVVGRRGDGRRLSLCPVGQERSLGQRSNGRAPLIANPAPAAKRKRFAAAAGVGVKRTSPSALHMSAYDPKRILRSRFHTRVLSSPVVLASSRATLPARDH
jgi:hypothetical protein